MEQKQFKSSYKLPEVTNNRAERRRQARLKGKGIVKKSVPIM